MKKTDFRFGALTISAQAYASQGNAILGIRDSGKTSTGITIAEKLFKAKIPFVTFDPSGSWRFMRVPGKGRGYKVVVAGGKSGDLPLTPATAPEILRAAMKSGLSLIIDLHDIKLSKADWKRIVKDCVRILLHENSKYGLRHIFIEEAAEFAPQKVIDGDVYAEVEKLARIGGNSRLGYTLINQRSQEVNKAVLELCENLFLHRQRGKNAIESRSKWLEVAEADERAKIITSMPSLPQGQCWAWLGGDKPTPPALVKVPMHDSAYPDRRAMRGTKVRGRKAVNVGTFVKSMKKSLVTVEAEMKANDAGELRKQVVEKTREVAALEGAVGCEAGAESRLPGNVAC